MKKIKNRKNGVRLIAFVMLLALLFSVLASTAFATTCRHSGKKTGNNKDSTCTEEGYIEYRCTKCDAYYYKPLEKLAHTYGEYKSVDGNYTRKICVVCGESYVLDATGARVDDASAIDFPIFAATFEGIETLADITAMFGGFSMTPFLANIIKNDPTGDVYLNIPSGRVNYAPPMATLRSLTKMRSLSARNLRFSFL